MKIIYDCVIINIEGCSDKCILINCLNGNIDLITISEAEQIKKWSNEHEINSKLADINLYNELVDKEYIMESENESKRVNQVIDELKNQNDRYIKDWKNAIFIFSYDCNFKCPYCYQGQIKDSNEKMSIDLINSILSLYPKGIETIGFFGGEPLLEENIGLIKYIIDKYPNAKYSIVTNGYNLDKYIHILNKVSVEQIQVTLDGNKESHDLSRRLKNNFGTFEVIIKNINLCLDNNIPIKIRMNITNENIKFLEQFQNEILNLLVKNDNVTFEFQELFQYNSIQKVKLHEKLLEFDTKTSSMRNHIFESLPPISNFIKNKRSIKPILNLCQIEKRQRFFDNKGNIYSCILAVGNSNKAIGTYYPKFNLFQKSILYRSIMTIEKCMQCRVRFICGGGCPNPVIDSKGNSFFPNCESIQYDISYTVPVLMKKFFNE